MALCYDDMRCHSAPACIALQSMAGRKAEVQFTSTIVYGSNRKYQAPYNDRYSEEYLTDEDLYPVVRTAKVQQELVRHKRKIPILLVILGGVVLLLFLILIFVGLLKGGARKDEKITLSYWGLWEKESVMQEMIRLYKISHPNVDIEYMLFDAKDNYRERLIERTKKGTGPDIFRYHNTWVPQHIGRCLNICAKYRFYPRGFQVNLLSRYSKGFGL